jgi:hypothetical protein
MIKQDLTFRVTHLQRLCTLLNFELSTSVMFLLQFLWQITLFLAAFAAILFTPYLLFVLLKEKKFVWLGLFIAIVLLPMLIIILFLSEHLFYLAFIQVPLLLFYLYCFMLRFDANEWLREMNWKIYDQAEKSEYKINDDFITLR